VLHRFGICVLLLQAELTFGLARLRKSAISEFFLFFCELSPPIFLLSIDSSKKRLVLIFFSSSRSKSKDYSVLEIALLLGTMSMSLTLICFYCFGNSRTFLLKRSEIWLGWHFSRINDFNFCSAEDVLKVIFFIGKGMTYTYSGSCYYSQFF
jgi:RsiW-degrading membrane proteinase PrsW (M82 family)